MDDVQRLAIEICQNRTDLSDEKKERIQRLLMESRTLADDTPKPSTSSQTFPGIDKVDLDRLLMSRRLSEFENLRMSRRFSKNRKIFGSDMCQNLGDMKREHKWPSPSKVLAAFRKQQDKPKLTRRLSDIVASKMLKERLLNGHIERSKQLNQENETSLKEDSRTFIIPEENQREIDTQNSNTSPQNSNTSTSTSNTSTSNSNIGLPKSIHCIDPSAFTPFKYKKSYTLRDVYRDLTLMRRAVSACLTKDAAQHSQPISENNSIEIKIESPRDDSLETQNAGLQEKISLLNSEHSDSKLETDPELALISGENLQMSEQQPKDQLKIINTNIMCFESKPGETSEMKFECNHTVKPRTNNDSDINKTDDEQNIVEKNCLKSDHPETDSETKRNADEQSIIKSEGELNSSKAHLGNIDAISFQRDYVCGEGQSETVRLNDMKTVIAFPNSVEKTKNDNGYLSEANTNISINETGNVPETLDYDMERGTVSIDFNMSSDKTKLKCQRELKNDIVVNTETSSPKSDHMSSGNLNRNEAVDNNGELSERKSPQHETCNNIDKISDDNSYTKQAINSGVDEISSHKESGCNDSEKDIVRLNDTKTIIATRRPRQRTTNRRTNKSIASKKGKQYDNIYSPDNALSKQNGYLHAKKTIYAACPVSSAKAFYDNIYDNGEYEALKALQVNSDLNDNVDSNEDLCKSETTCQPGVEIEHETKSNQNVITSDEEDEPINVITNVEKSNDIEHETEDVSEDECYNAEKIVRNENFEEHGFHVQSSSQRSSSDTENQIISPSKQNTEAIFTNQKCRNNNTGMKRGNVKSGYNKQYNNKLKLKDKETKKINESHDSRHGPLSYSENVKIKYQKDINENIEYKTVISQKKFNIRKEKDNDSCIKNDGGGMLHFKRNGIEPSLLMRKISQNNQLRKSYEPFARDSRTCRCCHRHNTRNLNKKPATKTMYQHHKLKDTFLNNISCDFSITPCQTKFSRKIEPAKQIDTKSDKLCTRNREITKKTNKVYRKNDNYNPFSSCFSTLIRQNTQSLTTPKYNANVSMEITDTCLYRNNDVSVDKHQKSKMNNESDGVKFMATSDESENIRKGSMFETTKEEQKGVRGISDDENDSVLDDNGDDDVFNMENEGDDRQKRRKSVMMSRNSCKSRTEFTMSSALSNQTPYSDYEYPDKEIAFDVISTILDDVIDYVWQANVAKFKHHVCKTNDLLGDETVGCILLIDEEKQSPISYSCKILNPSAFPTTVNQYEILIGNIVETDISNEYDVREGFVKIAIPFNKSNMRFFHEPILRTYDPHSHAWISIDSFENIYFDENDSDLSVLETNIREKTVYVVVARPTTEHIIYNNMYVEHDSRIDSDVTVSSPIGSRVMTDTVDIKFIVLPIGADVIAATRDSSDEDTSSLVGSSPIIIVEQRNKHPQPLYVSLPCERPRTNALKSRLSSAPSPEDSGYYTQSRLSKMNDFVETWTETESHLIRIGGCDQVKSELMTFREVSEDNKVSFCIHEHKTTCFVLETRKEASRPNIPLIALQLLKVFEFQRVVVSVMQNKDVIHDLTVTCDLRSRYATRWRRRLERDYDITSKIANLKEGDIVSINLRGNLTSIGKRFHVFRFHGSQSIKINWNLQVVDKYAQRTLDFYYGFVQLLNLKSKSCRFEEVDKIEGHDWDILLEIPVRLPKYELGSIPPPIRTKLQVIEEGPVTLTFLTAISTSLADHWMVVAQSLQISHARLQSLRRQNRNSDTQLVRDLLFTWFKNMPHAKEKATLLINILHKCGKKEMAETLQRDSDKYNNERLKVATECNFEKTLNTVIKSAYLISKWKDLASELGFSLEHINDIHNSANTEKDRCLNMLTKWTQKGQPNWLRNLARCTRRIGCKYVADHLLSTLTKQNQPIL